MTVENAAPTRNIMNPTEGTPAALAATQVPGGLAHDGTNGSGLQSHAIVDPNMNAMVSQFGNLGINGLSHIGGMFPMTTPDGRIIQLAANYTASSLPGPPIPAPGMSAHGIPTVGFNHGQQDPYSLSYGPPYLPSGGYNHPLYAIAPYTPARAGIAHERTDTGARELPGLEIRRSSYSTNESTPATPFLGGMAARDQGQRVTVFDRSTYTTPSPQQVMALEALQEPKSPLLDREPKIPHAIPAVFTPRENMKTLEQSLVNTLPGNRNVYIRGFHPTTDDALLLKYAERFGTVETSKAIIDSSTGACKGFGFAKFRTMRESENCIRGFYRRGYEVGFARESFNSRLRSEADPETTNLYLSNLPKDFRELEIGTLFVDYLVLSSKVLEDPVTHVSRGVGFARFESREVCDQVIKQFQGIRLGHEGMQLQIRYADSDAQKELKRITAKRRQFRTNEYNVSAYGTPLVGMSPAHGYPYRPNGAIRSFQPPRALPMPAQRDLPGIGGSAGSVRRGSRPGDGVEIRVDSPLVAHGSNASSPVKQEKE
ncbi:hypothetical protein F5Y05DRAFT_409519 [Hypoxylon sp. FL0543]|nr:hypothetical protein F5Y05DRAFT_409519 [Hypoxylon sp. FL0543]